MGIGSTSPVEHFLEWLGKNPKATGDTTAPAVKPIIQQSFGRVIERTVNDPQSSRSGVGIDFDSGKLWPPPPLGKPNPNNAFFELTEPESYTPNGLTADDPREQRKAMAWVRSNQVDAVALVEMDKGKLVKCGLLGPDMLAILVGNDAWDQTTPTQLAEQLARRLTEFGFIPQVAELTTDGKFPATFLFETRAHRMGILQITGMSDSGVKVRYKLLQGTNSPAVKAAPPPLSANTQKILDALFGECRPDRHCAGL